MNITTLQEDLDDVFNWTSILTIRDENGVLVSRETEYDDGTYRLADYEDGQLAAVIQTDPTDPNGPASAKSWESIETYYDENGNKAGQIRIDDNGVVTSRGYEDGTLSFILQEDTGPEGGAKSWDRIETYFDENGVRAGQIRVDDDGVVSSRDYEDGTLRYLLQEDTDAAEHSWDRIETYYDENGNKAGQIQVDDNGVVTSRDYDEGTLRYMLQEDTSVDAKNWDRIETYYDENGQRVARVEEKDNGVVIENQYDAGVLRISIKEDVGQDGDGGAHAWESISNYFDSEGTREARETIYDNGDVTAFFYEEGTRALRLDYDGDESHSWLVRETIYDENGQVDVVNTYDTAADVPPDYGFVVPA